MVRTVNSMDDLFEKMRQHRVVARFLGAFALAALLAMILFFGGYIYGAFTTTEVDPPISAGTDLLLTWWPAVAFVFAIVFIKGGRHVS